MSVHQVEVVVAQPQVYPQILEGREMILAVRACFNTMPSAAEGRKYIRIAPAVEEEALQFPQLDEIDTSLEHMTVPHLRQIALDAEGKPRTGGDRDRGVRIARRQRVIRSGPLVERGAQHGVRRKGVNPIQYRGLLAKMPLRIASRFLILGNIRLLEIGSTAHQQQLEGVACARLPVELRGAARAFAKVIKLFRLGRIQIATRGEPVCEKIVADLAPLPTDVRVEIEVVIGCAAEVHIAMAIHGRAGASGDIEDAAEAVAIFRRKTAGDQIHRFENLWADPGRVLRLHVVEKWHA